MKMGIGIGISQLKTSIGSSGPYVAQAVHFDGSTYLTCASGNAVNNNFFSASFWAKPAFINPDTANQRLFIIDPEGNYTPGIELISNGPGFEEASFFLYSADYVNGFQIGNQFQTLSDGWHHILMSGDMTTQMGQIYLDDVPQRELDPDFINAAGFDPGGNLSVNGIPWCFGGDGFPGDNLNNTDIADVWIAPGVSLLDVDNNIPEITRRKFISSEGKPVNPSGFPTASVIFHGAAASFVTNRGTGGAFALTGTLTDASTSPSD